VTFQLQFFGSVAKGVMLRQLRSCSSIELKAVRLYPINTQEQIDAYIAGQPEPKRSELLELHQLILRVSPACSLWFLDGKNDKGKIVSNPNIGYGTQVMQYADGKTSEFYQIGLSANTTGISIYIMGIKDKTYLSKMYGKALGAATVTGYCIKFKTLRNIHVDTLETAIRYGFQIQNALSF